MMQITLINDETVIYTNVTKIQYEASDTVMVITCEYTIDDTEYSLGHKFIIHRIPIRNILRCMDYRCAFD